jgi:hypothetical protein
MGTHPDIVESDRIIGSSDLLAQVRDVLRFKHYSIRAEVAYRGWIKRYILFHGKCHPRDMGEAEVEAFLNALAVRRQGSASTQNQALNALVFLYRAATARTQQHVKTTMIYTHVLQSGPMGVRSPLDRLTGVPPLLDNDSDET